MEIPPFRTAFQPIVDVETGIAIAQEALVRGPNGEGAITVLRAIPPALRDPADRAIRRGALATALRLGLTETPAMLSVNIYPSAVVGPHGVEATLADAAELGFPADRLVFEINEAEPVEDVPAMARTLKALQRRGVRIMLDDVGTGFARLPLLLEWKPDAAKVAREVIIGLDHDAERHAATKGLISQLAALRIITMVEGIETVAEMQALRGLGVRAMQGFLFARPGLEILPVPVMPAPL